MLEPLWIHGNPAIPGPRLHIANEQGGGIPNPYKQGLEVYRACADIIIRSMFAFAIVLREQT